MTLEDCGDCGSFRKQNLSQSWCPVPQILCVTCAHSLRSDCSPIPQRDRIKNVLSVANVKKGAVVRRSNPAEKSTLNGICRRGLYTQCLVGPVILAQESAGWGHGEGALWVSKEEKSGLVFQHMLFHQPASWAGGTAASRESPGVLSKDSAPRFPCWSGMGFQELHS